MGKKRTPRMLIGAIGAAGQYSKRTPRVMIGAIGAAGQYSKRRARPLGNLPGGRKVSPLS